MAQWQRVQHNQHVLEQMKQFYPLHLPMEVRYFFSQWIEDQPWHQISENNIQHAPAAEALMNQMLGLLQQKVEELVDKEYFIIKIKLEESYQIIQSIVRTQPLEMVQTIKNILAKEEMLLKQSEEAPPQHQINDTLHEGEQQTVNETIRSEFQSLFHRTKCTEDNLKILQDKQESFIIKFSDTHKIMAQIAQHSKQPASPEKIQKVNQLNTQKEQIDILLTKLAHDLLRDRNNLTKEYEQTIVILQKLQKEILDNKLISWKRKQQLAENGLAMAKSGLSSLQQWCDDLADLIWQNRQQIKKSTMLQKQLPIKLPDGKEDVLPELNDCITNLLSSLVTSTFIVELQPPQVLKKDARFSATVCLLVGGKLNVHMNPPLVKATIISERQASDLLKPKSELKAKDCISGEILNNTGNMEYQSKNGHLGITFKNMQLKKISRAADRRGSEAVTEEKFCILFQSDFGVGGNELIFQVWTLSLPVVVTVHGNQECNATATVFWDNAFAEPGRTSFAVPDEIEWPKLSDQLNTKFKYHTGKELTKANLAYVASKLSRGKDLSTTKVSWAQFNKDTLSNRNFTIWEWFFAILKLTKEHLKDLWTDDTIIGFVSKSQAQNMLSGQPLGTFLLRFSDSEIGGITIAWAGEKEVLHLAPFTAKDFSIRGLADRIRDLNDLVNLYPDKPKDMVFSKYYTSNVENMTSEGYIRPVLKTTIPEVNTEVEGIGSTGFRVKLGPQKGASTKFKSSCDTEIKQPLSQDSFYDTNLNSVQSMEEYTFIPLDEIPDEFMQMDIAQYANGHSTDYNPEDIDHINEITIDELNQQFSG